MGGIISNQEEIIEGKIVEEEEIIYDPKNPVDDIKNKYIWLSLHTGDSNFVFAQNQGFCIVGDRKVNGPTRVWLRQKRKQPI